MLCCQKRCQPWAPPSLYRQVPGDLLQSWPRDAQRETESERQRGKHRKRGGETVWMLVEMPPAHRPAVNTPSPSAPPPARARCMHARTHTNVHSRRAPRARSTAPRPRGASTHRAERARTARAPVNQTNRPNHVCYRRRLRTLGVAVSHRWPKRINATHRTRANAAGLLGTLAYLLSAWGSRML
eukprot:COSAG02_NODE_4927_length_4825_cov_9.987093_5_plen_184_part_00